MLIGEGGQDRLEGGNGYDNLMDSLSDDVLIGGDGQDILAGGAGRDSVLGGSGSDSFLFRAFSDGGLVDGDGADTILDFVSGEDKLLLRSGNGFGAEGRVVPLDLLDSNVDVILGAVDRDVVIGYAISNGRTVTT